MAKAETEPAPSGLNGVQIGLLTLLLVGLFGSIGARAWLRPEPGGPAGATPGNSLVAPSSTPPAEEPRTPIERSLPYVTESSFFGLIGFALGYTTRKFVKFGLIVLALFFVGLQALVWTGKVTVDWSGLVASLDEWIFNLRENESMTEFLTRRIPSGGGMLLGYVIGFRRG